jgi:uroporphyrinogen-III synthase
MILITRPKNEALLLSKELKVKNFLTFIEPLISFRYLKKKIIFGKQKIYIVTSLQAVNVLNKYSKYYKEIISLGNFLVVGEKVSSSLKNAGVNNIIRTFKTSELLTQYLLKLKQPELKLIYLCGSVVNEDFVNNMKISKMKFNKIIIYKTIPLKQLSNRCVNLIRKNKIDTVLIYSLYTANILIRLLKTNNLMDRLEQINIFCLSKRISQRFYKEGMKDKVVYARSPDQKGMFNLIMDKYPKD